MTGLRIKGVVFDMYGTLVDVGAVAEACKEMAPEPVAFNTSFRPVSISACAFLRFVALIVPSVFAGVVWISCGRLGRPLGDTAVRFSGSML